MARRNPSSAEVHVVMAEIHRRIPLYSPTEKQARDFADDVCDAFDDGETYGQVASTVHAKLAKVPFFKVGSDDIDYAIRSSVGLVCPGHGPKLP